MLPNGAGSSKVGFWFSTKKKKKLNCDQLSQILKKYGFEAVEIDTSRHISEQGPFVAIIHKFTDLMIDSMNGNQSADNYLDSLKAYLAKNPRLMMVDPLESIQVLLNRYDTYKLINETKVCSQDKLLHVPSFTQLSSTNVDEIKQQLKRSNVQFPFICKKNISHGSKSHKMCLIFNEEGLKDVDPPSVAQTFIDHGALLYKIYVIGDKYHMVERPSLRNFAMSRWKDHQTIFFNSHDISSGDSLRSKLTTLDEDEKVKISHSVVNNSIIRRLIKQLSSEIQMTMYGIDIIVCPKTQKHYVIDVNVFPGYDGVDEYLEILVKNIADRKAAQSNEPQQLQFNGTLKNTLNATCNGEHVSHHTTSNGRNRL